MIHSLRLIEAAEPLPRQPILQYLVRGPQMRFEIKCEGNVRSIAGINMTAKRKCFFPAGYRQRLLVDEPYLFQNQHEQLQQFRLGDRRTLQEVALVLEYFGQKEVRSEVHILGVEKRIPKIGRSPKKT